MDGQLFADLIQFSWTLVAFIFAAQGWIFLQEFKGNRVPKFRHIFLALAFLANVGAAIAVFVLLNLVLNASLAQTPNFVSDEIKKYRDWYTCSLAASFILTVLAVIAWQFGKNLRDKVPST